MNWVHRGGGGEEILDRHRSHHLGPPPIVTEVYISISTPVWTNNSTRTSRIMLQISTWLFDYFLSQSSSSSAALDFFPLWPKCCSPMCDNVETINVCLSPGDCRLWPLARPRVSQVPRAPGPAHSPDSQPGERTQARPGHPGSGLPSTAGSPPVSSDRGKHRIVCGRSNRQIYCLYSSWRWR